MEKTQNRLSIKILSTKSRKTAHNENDLKQRQQRFYLL